MGHVLDNSIEKVINATERCNEPIMLTELSALG
jgi:hypothetical protein